MHSLFPILSTWAGNQLFHIWGCHREVQNFVPKYHGLLKKDPKILPAFDKIMPSGPKLQRYRSIDHGWLLCIVIIFDL